MPVRYLLDTNTASYVIKGNIPRVRERLLRIPFGGVGISVVTEAELRYGVAKRPEAAQLKVAVYEFMIRIEVLPWDSMAAQNYARIRADLERKGVPMGNLDLMIAAQALASAITLVTHDHVFKRVNGLDLEDWASA